MQRPKEIFIMALEPQGARFQDPLRAGLHSGVERRQTAGLLLCLTPDVSAYLEDVSKAVGICGNDRISTAG